MHLRDETVGGLRFDMNWHAVVVNWRCDIHRVQHGGDVYECRRVREISPRTYPDRLVRHLATSPLACFRATYRRPNPNIALVGSLPSMSSFPSLRYRSGMNSSGRGYTAGSRSIALPRRRYRTLNVEEISAHQTFGMTVVPLGIKYPLYSSSSDVQ